MVAVSDKRQQLSSEVCLGDTQLARLTLGHQLGDKKTEEAGGLLFIFRHYFLRVNHMPGTVLTIVVPISVSHQCYQAPSRVPFYRGGN